MVGVFEPNQCPHETTVRQGGLPITNLSQAKVSGDHLLCNVVVVLLMLVEHVQRHTSGIAAGLEEIPVQGPHKLHPALLFEEGRNVRIDPFHGCFYAQSIPSMRWGGGGKTENVSSSQSLSHKNKYILTF